MGFRIHLFTSFCLLAWVFSRENTYLKKRYHYQAPPPWMKEHGEKLRKKINSPWRQELIISSISGDKRKLKKLLEFKKIKNLNLFHLLTPSGLHMAILLIPLKYLPRGVVRSLLLIFFNILLLYIPGFFAAKRVAHLKLWQSILPLKLSSPIFLFYFSLTIDLIFSNYIASPVSFSLSYLFLGIFFHQEKTGFKNTFLKLLLAQFIVSYFFQSYFSFGFFIVNLVTTFIFPPYFLSNILSFILPCKFSLYSQEWMHDLFDFSLNQLENICQFIGYFIPSSLQILLIGFCILSRYHSMALCVTLIGFLL